MTLPIYQGGFVNSRTKEARALGKALRSLENGRSGFDLPMPDDLEEVGRRMATAGPDRIFYVAEAFRRGMTLERVHELTHIDPWFLGHISAVIDAENYIAEVGSLDALGPQVMRQIKRDGIGDSRIAALLNLGRDSEGSKGPDGSEGYGDAAAASGEDQVRAYRRAHGIEVVYKRVDTCAAEFAAHTPYLYSSYESEDEAEPSQRRKIIILGSGPNRIGQGIEFDYCCVHAAMALAEEGCESIMVNCNPETVSTDYDTSDRLYFEPLTLEDVLAICDLEKPDGIIVQFGGQTPLKLAAALEARGVPIIGTSTDAIDRAEDRERFGELLAKLSLRAPRWGVARSIEEAHRVAGDIGFPDLPIMVRPSYVLGGQAMETIYDRDGLASYFERVTLGDIGLPLLIDQFLPDAIELDVDVVADKNGDVVVGGIMEHIEMAGIHSGDSACALPPYSLAPDTIDEIGRQASAIARELGVIGLMNSQFAVRGRDIYLIEVNPRASRTVPFVSKATGQPLAKLAVRVMMGRTLKELGISQIVPDHTSVKESVFPFAKFEGVDPLLGPEMRSTGEVMGIDRSFPHAFAKAQLAAGNRLPNQGCAFLSLADSDKAAGGELAQRLDALGFVLVATRGTAHHLQSLGLRPQVVNKVREGRPHCVDAMKNGDIQLVVNTTTSTGPQTIRDSHSLRRTALVNNIAYFTTIRGARAAIEAIAVQSQASLSVCSLQRYHTSYAAPPDQAMVSAPTKESSNTHG